MNFCLQYLSSTGSHLDVDYFDQLKQAMDAAESCPWADAFNIAGMGQVLHTKRTPDGKLDDWQGGIARFGENNRPSDPIAFIVG